MDSPTTSASKPGKASAASKTSAAGKVIAIANFKGGACKTTTAVNLAVILAAQGLRTLVVDADAQANTTSTLAGHNFESHTVGEWLLGQSKIAQVMQPILDQGEEQVLGDRLFLLPSADDMLLADQERELSQLPNSHLILANALAPLRKKFDYIILDCPPNPGTMTIMALCAADYYVVPLVPEKLYLDGMRKLVKVADGIQASHNDRLKFAGMLFCRYNPAQKRRLYHDIVFAARYAHGEKADLGYIRQDGVVSDAKAANILLHRYAPDCNGLQDYRRFTANLLAVV